MLAGSRYVEKFADMFRQTSFGRHDYTKKAEVIDRLMVGIEDCRAVFITYPQSAMSR